MPGIAGIISKEIPLERNKRDLHLMIECMMHEPFYTSGTFINREMGLYTGWVSHAGSFSDCMPILNEKKDVVLLFSGENFCDKTHIDQLREKGHDFDPSNASYLVHLYEDEGEEFVRGLNGWFSGMLVDLRDGKAFLFNDRYAMNRVYYHESKDGILFSTEAKSILRVKPELRRLDERSLAEFFACGTALQNRTLFHDISLLPGGSLWTLRAGTCVEKESYFSPREWEEQSVMEEESFYEKFRQTFRSILPWYFETPGTLAVSLTGGLDTRMIMANMDVASRHVHCFTFGGMYRDCFDVKIARKVAEECRRTHDVISIDGEFLSSFPEWAQKTVYVTDGGLDVCAAHEVYLNSKARAYGQIRLTGNYGSEVLRSINYIKASLPERSLLAADFYEDVKIGGHTFKEISQENQLSYAVFKLIPWYLYGRLSAAQSQLTVRTPFMDNNLVALMYRAPVDLRTSREVSLRLVEDGNPDLGHILTDRGVGRTSNPVFSKWVRLYREFLFKAEYRYNEGTPQWLSRIDYALRFLNFKRFFLGRHKIEHYRIWFRDVVSNYVQELLLDERSLSRPYVNKRGLERIVSGHVKGRANYTAEINKALTAELMQRLLIDRT
jgi:asparagine synthase (glutamine-hydrolysing)